MHMSIHDVTYNSSWMLTKIVLRELLYSDLQPIVS